MFKRLFWLIVGAGFGFGMSFWLARAVRQQVERYRPTRLSSQLATAVRELGTDLSAALAEGRERMHEREAELRADLRPRRQLPG